MFTLSTRFWILLTTNGVVLLGADQIQDGFILRELFGVQLVQWSHNETHPTFKCRWIVVALAGLLQTAAAVGVATEEEEGHADAQVGEFVATELTARGRIVRGQLRIHSQENDVILWGIHFLLEEMSNCSKSLTPLRHAEVGVIVR